MSDRPVVIGKGSYWKIRTGEYYCRFSMGKDPETGKYRYSPKRRFKAKSKGGILRAMEEYKTELNAGLAVRPSNKTVGGYAVAFHELRAGTMGSPLAYERGGYDVRHIQELFGNMSLKNLRPGDIKGAYAEARKNGRFSESELHRIHVKLSQIMDAAVADEFIARNPCATISVPMPKDIGREAPSLETIVRLQSCLLASDPSAQVTATLLMLECGMRKGEALGLTWGLYDEESRALDISQQYSSDLTLRAPKSAMSRRRVSATDTLADYLSAWKKFQREELDHYVLPQGPDTPLVHSISVAKSGPEMGRAEVRHMDGHNYSRWFRDFCVDNGFGTYAKVTKEFVKSGVKHVRGTGYKGLCPHQLRHAQATYLIGAGTDIKTVQARLGHANVSTTLQIYSHAIAANDRKAADAFEAALGIVSIPDRP